MINPDKKLAEVLGSRSIDMLKMAGAISKHLKKA
jgi:chromatin remodeling complex protein RSC6